MVKKKFNKAINMIKVIRSRQIPLMMQRHKSGHIKYYSFF